MSRYIDADALIDDLIHTRSFYPAIVAAAVKNAPTADVVEVVRCKECAHYVDIDSFVYDGKKAKHCVWHSDLRYDNDYCSDGIRSEK